MSKVSSGAFALLAIAASIAGPVAVRAQTPLPAAAVEPSAPPAGQAQDAPAPASPADAPSPPGAPPPEPSAPAAGAAPDAGAPAIAETAPPPPPPEPTLIVKADLSVQSVTVIENGRVKYTWPISSGKKGYRTGTGTFTPTWTSRMHYSRQWDWAPMPYAVFFNRGTAFHGTSATSRLGGPASHGCIRLATGDARTLYNLVHKHGEKLTRVIVHGAPKFKEPLAAQRRGPSRQAFRAARPRYASSYPAPYYEPSRRRRYRYAPRSYYQAPPSGPWD